MEIKVVNRVLWDRLNYFKKLVLKSLFIIDIEIGLDFKNGWWIEKNDFILIQNRAWNRYLYVRGSCYTINNIFTVLEKHK